MLVAALFEPLRPCGQGVCAQSRGYSPTAQRETTADTQRADQTRRNRDARIVGNCRFLGVRDAQTACNSQRSSYLTSQRNRIMSRTMTTNTPQASAKIYQFPVGGRRAVESEREQVPTVNTFGSWYHEAAIQESAAESRREH
jgi:Protein of unknown function (DUF2735)